MKGAVKFHLPRKKIEGYKEAPPTGHRKTPSPIYRGKSIIPNRGEQGLRTTIFLTSSPRISNIRRKGEEGVHYLLLVGGKK